MRYVVMLLMLAAAAVAGFLAAVATVQVTQRGMGIHPDIVEVIGWVVALGVAAGVLLLCRKWALQTFKRCPKCDSYVRTAAKKCLYCQSDLP